MKRTHLKLHGSLYFVDGRWRYSYRLPGSKKRTERLGQIESNAQQRQRRVSEIIDQVISKVITTEDAERLLGDERHIGLDLADYRAHLEAKGVDAGYIETTLKRISDLIALLGATRLRHITRPAVERVIPALRKMPRRSGKNAAKSLEGKPLSDQTVKHYLTALRQFTSRMKKTGRYAVDPLVDLESIKVSEDSTARRRDVTDEEMRLLISFAVATPRRKWNAMRAADRGMLYAFAFCTGLRASELRNAQTSWLQLDGDPPVIIVPAEFTKNGKRAVQPLPTWLAASTKVGLDDRTDKNEKRLFPRMPESLHHSFQADRENARQDWIDDESIDKKERQRRVESDVLKYKTADGVLVFHSLRHGFVSQLANTDVPAKLVQALARHSDIRTTMNRYAHAKKSLASKAVEQAIPNVLPQKGRRR